MVDHPALYQAEALLHELEARGVVRKAGHAVLVIIMILIVLGVLLGVGLAALFRRRR